MKEQFIRTEAILGDGSVAALERARVLVFGIGGVGGFAVEALARSGVGHLVLVDADEVALSNINRQIIATHGTVGIAKVDAMKERIADINPDCHVEALKTFYLPENVADFDFSSFDYVVDAIDTVKAKVDIASRCDALGVRLISAMGAGNKLDPTMFEVSDIYRTSVCPLARVMRSELKKRGVRKLKVVYSREQPVRTDCFGQTKGSGGHPAPGSISFVPSVMGLIIAGEVIKDIVASCRDKKMASEN